MPRSSTEKAKSPERNSHHLRSSPIEIPKRRRTASSPAHSPVGQVDSPDLIFEMSPISPDFPAASRSSSSDKHHEPFMYYTPSIRPYPSGTKIQLRTKKSCQRVMPSRNPAVVQVGAEPHHVRHNKTSLSRRSGHAHDLNPRPDGCSTTVTPSTTKITGFIPLIEHQPLALDEPSKPIKTLPPPPRRSSFSSSPWILPGRGGSHEGDVSYSQTDPSALEFRNHLLGRIENLDSSRFKSLHSCL